MDDLIRTLMVGVGATVVMDIWGIARKRLFGIAAPNYGLVGRWFAHMKSGRFHHDSIAKSPAISGERLIGWVAHYLVGIVFAAVLIIIAGEAWLDHPTLGPALLIGISTVAAPFLLMQPGMGAGLASSRTPRPAMTRLHSLITHTFFGLGLYAAGWVVRFFTHYWLQ